jgi:hypothetical protein
MLATAGDDIRRLGECPPYSYLGPGSENLAAPRGDAAPTPYFPRWQRRGR